MGETDTESGCGAKNARGSAETLASRGGDFPARFSPLLSPWIKTFDFRLALGTRKTRGVLCRMHLISIERKLLFFFFFRQNAACSAR